MATYDIDEVERAFRPTGTLGAVGEDWDAWSDLFTEDVDYIEHILGVQARPGGGAQLDQADHGRVRRDVHGVRVAPVRAERAASSCTCRTGATTPTGTSAPIDFPGMTVLQYAGDGKFSLEEDFWSLSRAQARRRSTTRRARRTTPTPAEAHPSSLGERPRLDEGRGILRREPGSQEGRVTGPGLSCLSFPRCRRWPSGSRPRWPAAPPSPGPADRVLGPEDVRPAARVARRPHARGAPAGVAST